MAGSLSFGSAYQTIDYIAGRNRNTQEAAARPARIRFYVDFTGFGNAEARLGVINFGALIMEEPTFSSGVVALDALAVGEIPLATAVVLGWVSNENGIYTGADMGFRISGGNVSHRFKFSLTFEGSTLRSTANTGMAVTPDGPIAASQSSTFFRR
jgi:hypothetical protein